AGFGADGRIVITASKDGTVRAWDVETGRSIGQFRPPQVLGEQGGYQSKNSAVLSPDNHYLLTSGSDGTAELWRIDSVWPVPQFVLPTPVLDVKFASNDSIVSSGTRSIGYWNLGTRRWTPGGMDFSQPMQSAAISVDEKSIVTVDRGDSAATK